LYQVCALRRVRGFPGWARIECTHPRKLSRGAYEKGHVLNNLVLLMRLLLVPLGA